MNANAEVEMAENMVESDSAADEVAQRLAQIADAMKSKMATGSVKRDLPDGTACPIDPAERALCEGCQ